ncbi:MAG: sugar transferase [Chloroflexota bacterium]|nr:sugar transferase [Chloroflexota bacterium]
MAQLPELLNNQKSIAPLLKARNRADSWSAARSMHRAASRQRISGMGLGERKLVQALCDWLVVAGGSVAILIQSDRSYRVSALLVSLAAVTLLWFFFADAFEAYKVPVLQSRSRSVYAASKVLLVTVLAYTLVAWFAGGFLPIVRPRISETVTILLLVFPLLAVRALLSLVLSHAPLRRRVAVVGANRTGYEMIEALAHYDGKIYEFVGYFDDDPAEQMVEGSDPRPFVLPTSRLLNVNDDDGIDQIVLANPMQTGPLVSTLSLLHERGVQITPMFALYQDLTGRVPVSHLGNDCFVALPAHVKSSTRTYMLAKRTFDIVMALTGLIVTAPLLPVLALAIKFDSPGPVFFSQVRVGRGGKPFKIIKFRSMRQDAEASTGAVWASNGDSRITGIGRFLRRSRLDEIPQLWNVLVGDMSFVGPRPERPEFDEELERNVPFYRARRAVRPGLTGWAQVSHGYGNTMLDALRKVEYDLYYIKNESLYLDLMIMLRTVAVVLKLSGK